MEIERFDSSHYFAAWFIHWVTWFVKLAPFNDYIQHPSFKKILKPHYHRNLAILLEWPNQLLNIQWEGVNISITHDDNTQVYCIVLCCSGKLFYLFPEVVVRHAVWFRFWSLVCMKDQVNHFLQVMLNTSNRKLFTQGIDSTKLREQIDELVLNMAVILTIINSDRHVKVDEFREFCRKTYLHVVSIPWIELTPSAHTVLGHSAELVEENGHRGLHNFTESGLEANNKFLRQYRIMKARKTDQHDNLSDCINRLWDD